MGQRVGPVAGDARRAHRALRRAGRETAHGEALAARLPRRRQPAFWPARRAGSKRVARLLQILRAHVDRRRRRPAYVIDNKKAGSRLLTAVEQFDADAAARSQRRSPPRTRIASSSSTRWPSRAPSTPICRSTAPGPYIVTDVASGAEVPSQVVSRDGERATAHARQRGPFARLSRVPLRVRTPPRNPDCCTVSAADTRIESDRYRVDRRHAADRSPACSKGGGDRRWPRQAASTTSAAAASATAAAENVGPVSATLRRVAGTPPRRVRVTLVRELDRVEVENEILSELRRTSHYRFDFGLHRSADPLRGGRRYRAARAGAQGGDFLPGTRADYMTLNHFVDLRRRPRRLPGHAVQPRCVRHAHRQQHGDGVRPADLRVSVLALGNVAQGESRSGRRDRYFATDFAMQGTAGVVLRCRRPRASALAHQNPLRAIALAREPERAAGLRPTGELLSASMRRTWWSPRSSQPRKAAAACSCGCGSSTDTTRTW